VSTERAHILIVDDDSQLLDLMSDTLSSLGYRIEGAGGGVEALEKLSSQRFDLMITDIKMPDMDGISLLKRVRLHYPDMPVLFITGYGEPEVIGRASPDGFLAKPFRISKIEELIEQVLSGRKDDDNFGPIRRVMVVDDDDIFRQTLFDILRVYNYLPLAVSNASEAMRELEDGEIDAVITDVKMPGVDGVSLLKQIKTRFPDIPVILITAFYSPQDTAVGQSDVTPDGFLQKPFKAENIIRLLEQLAAPLPHID